MGRTKHGNRDVRCYNIRGTDKIVQAGDCVLMRASESNTAPYVGRVVKIEADGSNNLVVRVRWYYRPEESVGGRLDFHGEKELFLSDHYDVQSAHTIEAKCTVHSFEDYTKLEDVTPEDYYCRFQYRAASGLVLHNMAALYCKCEMPYNPDDLMIQCEECEDWFHPGCINRTIEEVKQLDRFDCSQHTDTAIANTKAKPKRQKK
ncbi:chromatin remodeling protein EBS-like [Salvia miltiorrhiza]|uniref:chromatin remodeling protein EBS-like n=1 Tax=Salvia miltiorrhiza TaxID=226208 RepID=UPI0025AD93C5|nr:chromatin remodeling protein EBS-like [Salvia miltiorrhiza]